VTVVDFTELALSQLPPPPARVLEVGCGDEGGIVPALAAAGYDALGIDPVAPAGDLFRAITLEEVEESQYDAVVAERVFHHVHPLDGALDKVARLAPLLVVEEFAWDRIDERTQDWYESQHRILVAAGREPNGPPDLAAWRERFDGLHPASLVLRELRARFDERLYEERQYLYRWLAGPATEVLERALLDARAIEPIGFRWVGVSR
jgi:SAM-dependent methyltransferase